MPTVLDARVLGRLQWRCRRGLLENDLFIERFFARNAATLTERQAGALEALMELPDPDLLDLLLARAEPQGVLASDAVRELLGLMRARPCAGHAAETMMQPPHRRNHHDTV
jgi:antitoxin CptB